MLWHSSFNTSVPLCANQTNSFLQVMSRDVHTAPFHVYFPTASTEAYLLYMITCLDALRHIQVVHTIVKKRLFTDILLVCRYVCLPVNFQNDMHWKHQEKKPLTVFLQRIGLSICFLSCIIDINFLPYNTLSHTPHRCPASVFVC
jgi:hypothetical protein